MRIISLSGIGLISSSWSHISKAAYYGILALLLPCNSSYAQRVGFFDFGVDTDRAKQVSSINLSQIASNCWAEALEAREKSLGIRVALDKDEYEIGEPVHLFVYIWNLTDHVVPMPKSMGPWLIRLQVLDDQNHVVPKTPLGEWIDGLGSMNSVNTTYLLDSRVFAYHLDVTEIAKLESAGRFRVVPRLLLFAQSGDFTPSELNAPAIGFSINSRHFPNVANRPESQLSQYFRLTSNAPPGVLKHLSPEEAADRVKYDQLHPAEDRPRRPTNAPTSHPPLLTDTESPNPRLEIETDRHPNLLLAIGLLIGAVVVILVVVRKRR